MKLFHIADLHIGRQNEILTENFFELQLKFLKRLYETAQKKGIKFIVVAGDLFDDNFIPLEPAIRTLELMKSFSSINTIIIPGGGILHKGEITGHDAYTPDSIYRRLKSLFKDNLYLLTPENRRKSFENITFHAFFFEYPKLESSSTLYNVAIVHGAFGEGRIEGELKMKELDKLPFNYIALGHYHSFKASLKAAYSGAFIQFEFTKARELKSGYVEVELKPYGAPDINFIPFEDAPAFLKLSVISKEDLEELKNMPSNVMIEIERISSDLLEEVRRITEIQANIRLKKGFEIIKPEIEENIFRTVSTITRAIEEIGIPQQQQEEIKSILEELLYQRKLELSAVVRYLKNRYDL